ncbi:hypothetical protein JXD38_09760 [candidate division WOR-3 bacterium]|nr:hypothetical protein [candidate division WOR-3 bacterium]
MIERAVRFACLLACAGSLAYGANLTIRGVNRAEFWAYRDSWATHAEDKMDLNLQYGDLNGGVGLFLFEPSQPWTAARKPLRFFDYTVAYSPKQLEVLYGKFYQTFGKGLVLRAYSDDDFRHYKSLHGLRGTAHLPLSTDVVLLGARMRDLFFQEGTYKLMNATDTTDQVLGADLSSRPFDWGGLGARYVRVNRDSTKDITAKAFTELYGGNVSAAFGPVDLYGEVCQRLGTKPGIGGREKGLGYYLSGTAAFTGYSIVGEYMDYDRIAFPTGVYHWNDPPTPIKSGVSLNRGEDERGFGIIVTATPVGPLYLEGDYGRLYKRKTDTVGVVEWEGKTRYSLGDAWTFEAKFNHMVQQNVELHVLRRGTNRPTVHVNYLAGSHTVAFEGEYDFVTEKRDDSPEYPDQAYHESVLTLSYGYGAALLFTVGWQHVDQKLDIRYAGQQSWPMFEAVWNITQRNVLRVRVGGEKGGYTCSGGVCRFESPFTGAKLQLISRF